MKKQLIINIDTEYPLEDTMSFLNTNDNQDETVCSIDFEDGISIDLHYIDTGKNCSLKPFIFLRSGEGDYVPIEDNFYSIQEAENHYNQWTLEDLKSELGI